MSKTRGAAFRQADTFESSARLLCGFIGALVLAAIGEFFEGSRDSDIWFYALLVVLIVTAHGQGLLAATYNGFVVGLFFNFFFSSQSHDLSFDSAGDWWLELIFIAVGVVASLLGRWMPRVFDQPHREPASDPKEQGQNFLWNSRSSNGRSSSSKEKSWTS